MRTVEDACPYKFVIFFTKISLRARNSLRPSKRHGLTEEILGDIAQVERGGAVFNNSVEKPHRFVGVSCDIVHEILRHSFPALRCQKDRKDLLARNRVHRCDQAISVQNAILSRDVRQNQSRRLFCHIPYNLSFFVSDLIVSRHAPKCKNFRSTPFATKRPTRPPRSKKFPYPRKKALY